MLSDDLGKRALGDRCAKSYSMASQSNFFPIAADTFLNILNIYPDGSLDVLGKSARFCNCGRDLRIRVELVFGSLGGIFQHTRYLYSYTKHTFLLCSP